MIEAQPDPAIIIPAHQQGVRSPAPGGRVGEGHDFGFCLGANGCVAGNCVDETCEFECALAVVGEEEKILGTQLGLECHELRRCAPAREDAGFLFRQ